MARQAHDVLLQLEKDKSFKSIFDHDDEIAAKLADGVRCLDKVRKFEAKSTDVDVNERARAFQSLLLSALLVSADAADGASDLVEPLCACADKLFPATTVRKGKQSQDESELTGIELLCDCLLSFLELSSAFLRTSATNAFEAFSQDMTKESIGLLLSHLRTADEVAQDADEEEEEDEDEDMEDEEEVDEDGKPRASDTSATSDDDDEESDADADEDDEDDEGQEVDEELRARVRAVLKGVWYGR